MAERTDRDYVVRPARGGVSVGAILTGVVVAFGALFLLSALVGGVLGAIGATTNLTNNALSVGIGAGIALVIAQFLSYVWGGYTAGRMARGAGWANGILVPVVAIVIALIIGGIIAALGAAGNANLGLPFQQTELGTNGDVLFNYGLGFGIAALVAMLLGGLLGGMWGARWHRQLEDEATEDTARVAPPPPVSADRDVYLEDRREATVPRDETEGAGATRAEDRDTNERSSTLREKRPADQQSDSDRAYTRRT